MIESMFTGLGLGILLFLTIWIVAKAASLGDLKKLKNELAVLTSVLAKMGAQARGEVDSLRPLIKIATENMKNATDNQDIMIDSMSKILDDHIATRVECKTCETCGCLVDAKLAELGASKILVRFRGSVYGYPHREESLYTPYYCKRCYKELGATEPKNKKKGDKHE